MDVTDGRDRGRAEGTTVRRARHAGGHGESPDVFVVRGDEALDVNHLACVLTRARVEGRRATRRKRWDTMRSTHDTRGNVTFRRATKKAFKECNVLAGEMHSRSEKLAKLTFRNR